MRISDLFYIDYGHNLALNRLRLTSPGDGVAFVSRTSRNNGVSSWVEEIDGLASLPAGLLTVCLRSRNHALATFIQPRPFYTGYHVYVLKPRTSMTTQEKMWYGKCIEANRYRYNFGRQANRSLAALEVPDRVPEWVYQTPLPNLFYDDAGRSTPVLDVKSWSDFSLGSLFEVRRGRNVLRREMMPGNTPYVSALSWNNGVSAAIDVEPEHEAGCITVASNGNGVGCAFYQPEAFVASGDVSILVSQERPSAFAALFVCTIIYNERYRWNYGRKWVTSRLRESVIKLPATSTGDPDWNWMDRYVRSLPLASAVS